ncbi:hypothetical protein HDF11_003800 [Tunturiibacter psychrotolerans]
MRRSIANRIARKQKAPETGALAYSILNFTRPKQFLSEHHESAALACEV